MVCVPKLTLNLFTFLQVLENQKEEGKETMSLDGTKQTVDEDLVVSYKLTPLLTTLHRRQS